MIEPKLLTAEELAEIERGVIESKHLVDLRATALIAHIKALEVRLKTAEKRIKDLESRVDRIGRKY